MKPSVQWIVQTNLSKEYASEVLGACERLGYRAHGVEAIPFDKRLPEIPSEGLTLCYGSINWIDTMLNGPWFPVAFQHGEQGQVDHQRWTKAYGRYALNRECIYTPLEMAILLSFSEDKELFVRSAGDDKQVPGQIMTFKDICEWHNHLTGEPDILANTEIVIAEPYRIRKEWRCFMVAGEVSSASQYREDMRYKPDSHVPQEVIMFAEARAEEYTPAPVFVMDIAKSGKGLYVLEIGTFNSAGFYASDVEKIVKDVTEFTEAHYRP